MKDFDEYYKNNTLKQTAIRFNITVDQVRYLAKKNNIIKEKLPPYNKVKVNIDELILYYNDHTLAECSKKFNLSAHQLGERLKLVGYNTNIHYKSKIDFLTILEYLNGHSLEECVEYYRCSKTAIRGCLRRNGIYNLSKFKAKKIDINKLIIDYQELTQNECGIKYGISSTTVGRLLNSKVDSTIHFGGDFSKKMSKIVSDRWNEDDYKNKMAVARSKTVKVSSIQKGLYKLLDELKIDYFGEEKNPQECIIGPFCFDCVIPNHKLLIEVNGDYWHSLDRVVNNDLNKSEYIAKYFPDYKLRYLWEHEFNNLDRIKNLILYWMGLDKLSIRQFDFGDLILSSASFNECKEFLGRYHYLGRCRGGYYFKSVINQEMMSCCVFSPIIRQNLPYKDALELSRFCIHPEFQVKNLASFLISRFIKLLPINFHKIISYSDSTFNHSGAIYKACNFTKISEVQPDYWYVGNNNWVIHKKTVYNRAVIEKMSESEYVIKNNLKKVFGGVKNVFEFNR